MDFLTDTDDKDDFVVPQRTLQGNKNQARQNVRGGLTSLFVTEGDVPSGNENHESGNNFTYRAPRKNLAIPQGERK